MAPVPFPSACPAAPRPSWRSFRSPQRARQRRAHHGARSVPLSVPAAPIMASARGGERQALALPSRGGGSGGRAAMEPGESRPAVATTLRALNEALGRPAALWVKESGARNLRHRDFLAPRAALRAAFPGGQVPADVVAGVASVAGPGVLAVRGCEDTPAGLAVRVRRPEAFRRLLGPLPAPGPAPKGRTVLLHVPALRRPDAVPLRPSHLRPLLLADHLARLLRAQGVSVSPVPAVTQEGGREVLRQLRVEWPSGSGHSDLAGTVSALKQALGRSPWAAACEHGLGTSALPEDVICEVHLRGFMEQQDLAGGQGSCCIVHVVSCEEEFQQQQLDLLWRILDPGAHTALQKHLVCGPVKVTNPSAPIEADQYFQLRKRQMYEASVMKYGELAQDEAWTEVIDTLTVAAIRFEMLSTAHQSQLTLDLEDSSISTKGTKSGAFVMYNCARLATLFATYQRAVEQGTYPPLPPASELNFSCLREEGEWLLLFNYLLPFPEVLQQAAQLPTATKGIRITAHTETVCKFLIQLSMDFSSYYNRVHVLGEPFPHLFDQMFARLQLLGAIRDVFHSALATLHLPPLSQI
ncbi:DALR anticodon-binding domain-containing protein 3 isoform X2 [Colius striatus]|uniref:DALR anticodon-binding domain-containing protein 3 isoform X2 n=1 Tax=Colius striatus TaxID=57412 RepID=UPI002B1CF402|nr:DALR anticodon-binding domain-containing protein 3 isoform X2 [Colius striatus]